MGDLGGVREMGWVFGEGRTCGMELVRESQRLGCYVEGADFCVWYVDGVLALRWVVVFRRGILWSVHIGGYIFFNSVTLLLGSPAPSSVPYLPHWILTQREKQLHIVLLVCSVSSSMQKANILTMAMQSAIRTTRKSG